MLTQLSPGGRSSLRAARVAVEPTCWTPPQRSCTGTRPPRRCLPSLRRHARPPASAGGLTASTASSSSASTRFRRLYLRRQLRTPGMPHAHRGIAHHRHHQTSPPAGGCAKYRSRASTPSICPHPNAAWSPSGRCWTGVPFRALRASSPTAARAARALSTRVRRRTSRSRPRRHRTGAQSAALLRRRD